MSLAQIQTTNFIELRRRLLELHPQIDEVTLADTLEGAVPEADQVTEAAVEELMVSVPPLTFVQE